MTTAPGRIEPHWPLLLLPGTLCDARVFGPMFRALAGEPAMASREVIDGDMTGLGSASELAQRILASAPDRFIPVGFSLGAIVALEMALAAPSRIGAMVLMAANGRDVPETDHAARRLAGQVSPPSAAVDQLWPRYVAPSRQQDAGLRALITGMAASVPPGTLAQQTEVALTRSDKRPMLGTMPMPALILGGGVDLIAPPELQRELAQGLPRAELHFEKSSGHFLPLECPEFCSRTLAEWLGRAQTVVSNPMEVS